MLLKKSILEKNKNSYKKTMAEIKKTWVKDKGEEVRKMTKIYGKAERWK